MRGEPIEPSPNWQRADFQSPWPNLELYAALCGEVDPEDADSALFRGEEAFAPDVTPTERWSKPSPEPRLDDAFEPLLLDSIRHSAPLMSALARGVAAQIAEAEDRAPVLVAILRAGVPVAALLSPLLEERFGEPVPIAALSLFDGLGWDEAALQAIVRDFPDRPLWFVDGWTSAGGVAGEMSRSFARWQSRGLPDFLLRNNPLHQRKASQVLVGPRLAVLCDPRGKAHASAARADVWVPSCAFTAPRTLGFSRGFWRAEGEMFGVYEFPKYLLRRAEVNAWLRVLGADPAPLPRDEAAGELPPREWRVHVNEVMRALINRSPREVLLRDDEAAARESLAPLMHLCESRAVPVRFGRAELSKWNTLAAARMSA